MPVLQTSTKISSYTSDTQAQDYYDEYDPDDPTTWPPCDICECDYDYYGFCCCDVYEYPDDPTSWITGDGDGSGGFSNWINENILSPVGEFVNDFVTEVGNLWNSVNNDILTPIGEWV
jgi:hypothetical protein